MLRLEWFKNPDNVVYADIGQLCDNFGKETGIENLRDKIEEYRAKPDPEGIVLTGRRRTSVRMFIPNLYFDEPIEMGDTVWLYMGESYECYCLFCYCPLYLTGDKCGGNFTYTDSGVKDCSSCLVPHEKDNYDYIMKKMSKEVFSANHE